MGLFLSVRRSCFKSLEIRAAPLALEHIVVGRNAKDSLRKQHIREGPLPEVHLIEQVFRGFLS